MLSKIQATEFTTPGHVFYQLNELPKRVKTLFKKLAIDRPCNICRHTRKKYASAMTGYSLPCAEVLIWDRKPKINPENYHEQFYQHSEEFLFLQAMDSALRSPA